MGVSQVLLRLPGLWFPGCFSEAALLLKAVRPPGGQTGNSTVSSGVHEGRSEPVQDPQPVLKLGALVWFLVLARSD